MAGPVTVRLRVFARSSLLMTRIPGAGCIHIIPDPGGSSP